jgi:hypothetical protein
MSEDYKALIERVLQAHLASKDHLPAGAEDMLRALNTLSGMVHELADEVSRLHARMQPPNAGAVLAEIPVAIGQTGAQQVKAMTEGFAELGRKFDALERKARTLGRPGLTAA